MTDEQEFNVAIDALASRRDALWKLTESNMNAGLFGIIDQIRLDQIE